jgi:hypothetical protein
VRSIAIALLVLTGCAARPEPPQPVPIPPTPIPGTYVEDQLLDGLGTPAGTACRSLRAAHCAEGFRDGRTKHTCFQRLEHHAEIAIIPYRCIADAKTPDAIRACGTPQTLRFRCVMPSVDDPAP